MKKLSCKDMGMDDEFVVEGKTEEDVVNKMMEHAREVHSDVLMDKTMDEMTALRNAMREKMKEV